MPVAPRAEWLDQCLEGIARQTSDRWELIVVLDGECQQNRDSIERSGAAGRCKILALAEGSGVATALNAGMADTDAEFVARIDADDVCMPERVQVQLEEMRRRPSLLVLGSAAVEIDEVGAQRGIRTVPTGSRQVRRALQWRNALIHPSVIMRRQPVLAAGGYNVRSERAQDYELWLRLMAVGELDNQGSPLIQYRLHATQHSRGPRLAQTKQVRAARHRSSGNPWQHLQADARHLTWLTAQAVREVLK